MKKSIILLSLFLMSCGHAVVDNRKPIIIDEITSLPNEEYVSYYGKGYSNDFGFGDFKIYDLKGKYNIGDTIKLTK